MELTSVLIVDDEPAVRDVMARWVSSLGLRPDTAASADEALETLRHAHYDLAVIDVVMPGHDGLWLADEMRRDHPHTAVVIATAYSELLVDGEWQPIADLLVKPIDRARFELALDRGRQWRRNALEDVEWHARLAAEIQDRAEEISDVVRHRAERGTPEVVSLVDLVSARLPETMAHSERVARYAASVARHLEVDRVLGLTLRAGALFHDLGKAAIPDALLSKPSPLTPAELAVMRRHVDIGAAILESTDTLAVAAPIVLSSHEWFGGGGYPRRLSGDEIPLASRIITVVDAYDAMTHDRSYRYDMGSAHAVAELLRCSPAQFDPEVVEAFLAVLGNH